MIRWAKNIGNPSTVLTRDTKAKVSKQIRWLTWSPGEKQGSWVNHYIYLLRDLWTIVEALAGGVEEGTLRKYSDSKTTWGVIVEHVGFTEDEHAIADGAALAMVGEPYSYVSFMKQAIDGVISKVARRDIYGARRIALPGISATICSQLGVKVHKVAGWIFMGLKTVYRRVTRGFLMRVYPVQVLAELPARRATPDDVWDDIFEHRPMLYRVVGEINPELRPPDLIPAIGAKIDADLAYVA